MKLLSILLLITLFYSAAFASPAIQREIIFRQPDGTSFKGRLHGDASFHWIESDGNIVIYNPQDRYYYKAVADKERGLIMTSQRVLGTQRLSGLNAVKKDLTQNEKEVLYILYRKSKTSNHPR